MERDREKVREGWREKVREGWRERERGTVMRKRIID